MRLYLFSIKFVYNSFTNKRTVDFSTVLFILVEAVGFEPTSKSISEGLSPSAADTLEFVHVASRQQTTQSLSRFSLTLPGAHARFSCIIDARSVTCR